MIKLLCPAKVNLTLEVLGKRPDGYHEIRSVMQTVSLYDSLSFAPSEELEVSSKSPGWRAGMSLVPRAAEALRQATGYASGARIEVAKLIPLLSGLGGDSANAATALNGLNRLWELRLSPGELAAIGAALGSDVPFFVHGGTALASGRGEVITPLPDFPHRYLVIVIPDVPRLPGKTARKYIELAETSYTSGELTYEMAAAIREGREPPGLFNVFEAAAFSQFSELNTYLGHLAKTGVDNIHLAGSGPALFSIIQDAEEAQALHIHFLKLGLEAYLTETIGTVAD